MGSWGVGVSFGGHHSARKKAETFFTHEQLSQEWGEFTLDPSSTAMGGEARLVVGGLSRAGGLAGSKPWPGCLGAGCGVCTEAPEVIRMQVLS